MWRPNSNPLSWSEWIGIALAYVPAHRRIGILEYRWDELRRSWQFGEDPTDWAAEFSRGYLPRKNPDRSRRQLERRAAAGGPQDRLRYVMERRRRGELPFGIDAVVETVRARPGITRLDLQELWQRSPQAVGGALVRARSDSLVYPDAPVRLRSYPPDTHWLPGPDTRPWHGYGCWPPDALHDAALTLPRKGSRRNVVLRELEGALGLARWASEELDPILVSLGDEGDAENVALLVQETEGMLDYIRAGGHMNETFWLDVQNLRDHLRSWSRSLQETVPERILDERCPEGEAPE